MATRSDLLSRILWQSFTSRMKSPSQVFLCCLIGKVGDWTIRIDPPHGNAKYHRQHVHIQKRGLRGEYSWNSDGTRHDEHRFPSSEKCIAAAKRHAASALNIPILSLNFIIGISGGARISVRTNRSDSSKYFCAFNTYLRRSYSIVALGSDLGLVLVLTDDA